MTGSALTVVHRDHIIALAARYKLPAVYYEDFYVAAGGLISYGTDNVDQFRRAAGYGGSASFSASGSWHSA